MTVTMSMDVARPVAVIMAVGVMAVGIVAVRIMAVGIMAVGIVAVGTGTAVGEAVCVRVVAVRSGITFTLVVYASAGIVVGAV